MYVNVIVFNPYYGARTKEQRKWFQAAAKSLRWTYFLFVSTLLRYRQGSRSHRFCIALLRFTQDFSVKNYDYSPSPSSSRYLPTARNKQLFSHTINIITNNRSMYNRSTHRYTTVNDTVFPMETKETSLGHLVDIW